MNLIACRGSGTGLPRERGVPKPAGAEWNAAFMRQRLPPEETGRAPVRKIVTNALDPAAQTPLDGAAARILADVHSDFLVWHLVAAKPELREYKAVYGPERRRD